MADPVAQQPPSQVDVGFDTGRRRYVAAFGLGFFLLCQLGAPVLHFTRGTGLAYYEDPIPLMVHALGIVAASAIGLGHRSARLSAEMLVWTTWAAIWLAVFWSMGTPHAAGTALLLCTGPLLAGFLVSARQVVAVGACNVLGASLLGATAMMPPGPAVSAALLTVVATMVMGITAFTRRLDEAVIGGQARQLAARASELEAIMEAATDGMIALDHAGRVVNANPAARRLTGGGPIPVGTLLDDRFCDALMDAIADLRATGQDAPVQVALEDGNVVRLSMRCLPGPRKGHLLSIQDVTQEEAVEQQRRLAETRRAEIEKLQEVTRFKSNLLNAASHELNTPLTPVRLQMELLRSPDRGPLTPKQTHSLDILDRNIQRLSTLIGDILDVAKLDGARLPLRCIPVSLETLVRDEVEGFIDNAQGSGLAMEADIDGRAWVWGDPARLGQVLANLISNAIKFTSKGNICVRFRVEDDWAIVSVEDTGIGVPIGSEAGLFEPFSQLHEVDRDSEGSGMGLYISKGIIEAHGGTMGYERAQGGSRFWFRIPTDVVTLPPPGQLVPTTQS